MQRLPDYIYILFALSLCSFGTGIYLSLTKRNSLVMFSIWFAAFFFYLAAALLDDFVNIWDERFHALVAKNSMNNPLRPGLYSIPVLGDFTVAWDLTAVWLHKQPLFTWLMALSYKIFGVNYWAGRIPSVVLMSFVCSYGYSVVSRLLNGRTALIGMVLMLYSYYSLSLVSGRQFIDQNDAMFIGFVALAFFLAIDFVQLGSRKKLLLSAFFTACAILTKWLPGLYAFGFLALVWVQGIGQFRFKDLVQYIAIVLTLVLPWQIFAWFKYPEHYMFELKLNSAHFTKAVEGQVRDWDFHFLQFPNHYGYGILVLAIIGIVYSFIKKNKVGRATSILVVFVFAFYTAAQTRMPSFTYIAMCGVMLLCMFGLQALFDVAKNRKWVLGLIAIGFSYVAFENSHTSDLYKHFDRKGPNSHYRNGLVHNKNWFQKQGFTDNDVIFNMPRRTYVELMFYTDAIAYPFMPSKLDLAKVKAAGMKLHVFKQNTDTAAFNLPKNAILVEGELKYFE